MLDNIWEQFVWLIGGQADYERLSVWQVVVRTAVIYLIALVIIRVGKRRFMGNYSAFDILLGFIVGSVMARGITGAIRFLDMVIVVSVLMLLHWLIATVSFYWEGFSRVVENTPRKLIVDGEMQKDAMEKSKIAENDLMQALRDRANTESPEKVKTAYLERDGNITVVLRSNEPRVIDVDVKDNVQTVRIVLSD